MKILNECGGCTMCCDVLPVPQLNKPENTLCINCVAEGCGIHATRPSVCRDFQCYYTLSEQSIEFRPDKTDCMFELVSDDIMICTLHRRNLNAWKDPKIQIFINELKDKNISTIITSYTNQPKEFILADGVTKIDVLRKAMDIYVNEYKNKKP